jgi:CheY-like chemotaxis protein
LNKTTNFPRRLKVLVVEDDADMAHIITEIFKVKGCDAIVSNNCIEAFTIIQTDTPDIVSCDIRLSGKLTGLDLASMVRSDSQIAHLFLIAISGFHDEKERALNAGFDLFFSKPVKFSDLTKAIEIFSENTQIK